ncbi:restriction alleviation protein, Lar family [bacterium M00.F.Ca.ET.159.01.1.1]|nr:restriction alleviation protein, Lar family [bacterium M00.F.Ca.ET.159.01.1.1]TGT79396.1 restriction alleviation protein, Lar family [bacterium M00.F.Ca.ET.157.01.1.1]
MHRNGNETMPDALKACPFCGFSNTEVRNFKSIWFVVCNECHADGPAEDSEQDATEAWNTRHTRKRDGDGKH